VVFELTGDEHKLRLRLGAPRLVQASCDDPNTKQVRPFKALKA
jgi:hypothetical protein